MPLNSCTRICLITGKYSEELLRYNWAASWENRLFAYAKTKTQISFALTAKLISAFVFATRIVQLLYFLNPKNQVFSNFLWVYSAVCVWTCLKPQRKVFSRRGSYNSLWPVSHTNVEIIYHPMLLQLLEYMTYMLCGTLSRQGLVMISFITLSQ